MAAAYDEYVNLPGSERGPLPGASSAGPLDPAERVEVTVVLRPDPAQESSVPDLDALGEQPAGQRRHLSRDELAVLRGASPADIEAVRHFAEGHRIDVTEVDRAGRRVVLAGATAAMNDAFRVSLERFEHPAGSYRGHAGPVSVVRELAEAVVAVLGLDNRPQADFRLRPATRPGTSYTPLQVAAAYQYPRGLDGGGQTIAFIELGGGYRSEDLTAYFTSLGLRIPDVRAVPVDGGANAPTGDPAGPDGEVMLDLEVAGAVANGARLVAYFAPNTDQGFVDAVSAAVHDSANQPCVISISWGGPESSYTGPARTAFENALTDAALAGVTVCVAAGDNGCSDGVNDGLSHVDYPASSPRVLACGGTSLVLSGTAVSSEVVWNDQPADGATGGGVSAAFPVPAWQAGAGVPPSVNPGGGTGRGVPDVAGDADPATGYQVRVDGTDTVVGGTSAVAPLWAALIAIAVQSGGRTVGFVNPLLYKQPGAFRDVTTGNNGSYQAGPGWDACTGLGSPVGSQVLGALGAPG